MRNIVQFLRYVNVWQLQFVICLQRPDQVCSFSGITALGVARTVATLMQYFFCSKLNKMFLEYFDPENTFLGNENK